MTKFTYTKKFSEKLWLPFKKGSGSYEILINKSSTKKSFFNNKKNWKAKKAKGAKKAKKFTKEEMESNWLCLLYQKARIESYYLVSLEKYKSYNEARKTIKL